MRFFALHRTDPGAPVQIEAAETLAQIEHNAILREFARYYDDEQRYTLRELSSPPVSTPVATKLKPRKKTAKTRTSPPPLAPRARSADLIPS